MLKALVLTAALGLTVSGASACELMRSAKSLDKTTVASIVNPADAATPSSMSTPADDVPPPVEETVPADREG
jgi:hypothetical protein